jgi:hypothetical protein
MAGQVDGGTIQAVKSPRVKQHNFTGSVSAFDSKPFRPKQLDFEIETRAVYLSRKVLQFNHH